MHTIRGFPVIGTPTVKMKRTSRMRGEPSSVLTVQSDVMSVVMATVAMTEPTMIVRIAHFA